jgi:peptidylprolyl isomerase
MQDYRKGGHCLSSRGGLAVRGSTHTHSHTPVEVAQQPQESGYVASRRVALGSLATITSGLILQFQDSKAQAEDRPEALCTAECVSSLDTIEKITTPSGLQYQDIVVGNGPSPPVGYQVVVNYIAMTPEGRVFDSSLERGAPYDLRVGAGQVVAGLDEGLLTMKVGGIRRLYIPGNLSFPKGLPAGPGRPRVPPSSPVVFDVQLLLVPGLDDEI